MIGEGYSPPTSQAFPAFGLTLPSAWYLVRSMRLAPSGKKFPVSSDARILPEWSVRRLLSRSAATGVYFSYLFQGAVPLPGTTAAAAALASGAGLAAASCCCGADAAGEAAAMLLNGGFTTDGAPAFPALI